jgi:hypothetical protein
MPAEKFGNEFATEGWKFRARKKPLKILGLVSAITFAACLKSPLLYLLS